MCSSIRASTIDFYDLSNKNVKESYSVDLNRKRGHVLIVNILVFTNSYVPTREGSEIDVLHLRNLFEDLKFTVVVKDNLKADDMRSAIKEFANRKDHTSSFVFILSHGTKSYGVDGKWEILYSDDKAVAIDEVMTMLSNKEANHLSGKLRCIVVNICSEITCDRSAANPRPNPVSNPVPNVCGNPSIRESNRSVDDMTLVILIPPGCASSHDKKLGSVLFRAFVRFSN
ncbi:caspase-12-like [Artemia franciscana]|uniref:caspase-12-like n=1 Tax=Artemia franciscana TaxID=6661 RepID=UPI0032DAB4BA